MVSTLRLVWRRGAGAMPAAVEIDDSRFEMTGALADTVMGAIGELEGDALFVWADGFRAAVQAGLPAGVIIPHLGCIS